MENSGQFHTPSYGALYTSYQSLLINVIVYHIAEGGVSLQEADRML